MEIFLDDKYDVTCHTDFVKEGSTFVVIKGFKFNGVDFIKKAVENGAKKIVIEYGNNIPDDIIAYLNNNKIDIIKVEDARKSLAYLSNRSTNFASKKLKIIAITGTKGKSTTAYITEYILRNLGFKTALISSIENRILNQIFKSSLTTPNADYIHNFLNIAYKHGVEYVVMEVSAQAISLDRIHTIYFDLVLFTNLSYTHAEFYNTEFEYFNAKLKLLNYLKKDSLKNILVNYDDNNLRNHFSNIQDVQFFGNNNDQLKYYFTLKKLDTDNSSFKIYIKDNNLNINVDSSLIGMPNVYNITGSISIILSLPIDIEDIKEKLESIIQSIKFIPGRLEKYQLKNGAIVFIDFAHNDLSFISLFDTLKCFNRKIISLFGNGGERDRNIRPKLGAIASKNSDIIILTSDNPRFEDPNDIVNDIKMGIDKDFNGQLLVEIDRENAIKMAYKLSDSNSIILLLAKGNQNYQIIKDKQYYFSEADILKSLT